MSVTQVKQAVGSWNVRLRGNIPKRVLNVLEPFGHIAIVPGGINVAEHGDNILASARYVGVYRSRADNTDGVTISGVGLEYWLGDENGAGDVFETALEFNGVSFATAINGSLPASGAITAGVINSLAGLYTGRHQWVTSRKVLDYITGVYGAEWRVNSTGTLDAGTVAQLYNTTPKAILVAKEDSSDLRLRALPGNATMVRENIDYTTRVVVLGEGEGETIQIGTADQPSVPYKDLHGNEMVNTRVFSESFTQSTNADTRAALLLNEFGQPQAPNINLSTSTYDLKGNVQVGDYIYVYNPDAGFEDAANETTWNGEIIHPVKLRVVELSWPIRQGWTVAYRNGNGVWTDLSSYVFYEGGDTNIVVGDLPRSLTGGGVIEPIGSRPNPDSSIPAAPGFTSWSFGAYQSNQTNTTKAVIRVAWNIPLNTDGSTVLDGSHYEIRYRVSEVLGYQVRWGQLTPYRWGALSGNRWGAPITEPVSVDPEWIYMSVPWGTNETTILELTPGVTYEFQIRGVDAATPPHQGPWSASSFQTTTGDLFAPSTPAAPIVAGNMAAIQVIHHLGKDSGGTFNLEPDVVRLTVHVGGSDSFFPDESNQVGELAANIGMITGQIASVGTFPIMPIEQVHVKVVAVDRTGNKSSASPSAVVTVQLVDDAHISNLTASKITAGTITAETILANLLEVGTGGIVAITQGSFQVKDALGRVIVQMGLLPDGKYGLRVNDDQGNAQIRAGELLGGGYGLEAVDETGQLVSLSTLAFGMEAAMQPGSITVDTGGGGNPIRDPDNLGHYGIRIGTSRRALVILSSEIGHNLNDEFIHTASMSLLVRDRLTGLVTILPSSSWDLLASVGGNVTGVPEIPALPSLYKMSHVGLIGGSVFGTTHFPTVPGEYDFEVWYHAAGEVFFQSRMIVIMPF